MIEALAFDAYGTLFDVHAVVARCEAAFPERGADLSGRWRAKQLEYTWLLTLMDRYEDFWAVTRKALGYACRAAGVSPDAATETAILDEYLRLAPFADATTALAELSRRVPLAILSNGSPRMLDAIVDHAGLRRLFTHVLSADAVRAYKPSPRVYELAERAFGCTAGSIGFVSANGWDSQGAKAFGLHAIALNRTGAPPEALGFTPDRTIGRLAELLDIV